MSLKAQIVSDKENSSSFYGKLLALKVYFKWKKVLLTVMLSLTMLLVLIGAIMFKNRIVDRNGSFDSTNSSSIAYSRNINSYSNSYCTCGGSTITCTGVTDVNSLEEELQILGENCSTTDHELIVSNSPLTVIPSNFLSNLNSLTFKTVSFLGNSISDIEDEAFNTRPFRTTLKTFVSDSNRIEYLRKDSFKGLTNLGSFAFRYSSLTSASFEYGCLEHIKYINTLQINSCIMTEEGLRNVTGSNVALGTVQNVDLRFNTISDLENETLNRLTGVTLLNINNVGLERIEVNAFKSLTSLQTLNLAFNQLKTLPEGVLDNVKKTILKNNTWICDCDLLWLQTMYMNTNKIDNGTAPTCFNKAYLPFDEVVFCTEDDDESEESSEEIHTTTPSTEINITETDSPEVTTIAPNKRLKEIKCRDWKSSPLTSKSAIREFINYQYIFTENEHFEFEFYEVDDEEFFVETIITGNITSFHLLWFNSHNTTDTGCVTNMENNIYIDNLKRNTTYTICIVYSDHATVAPYDCFGLKTLSEYGERAWIRNKHQNIILIVIAVFLTISIILSATLTYFCLRKYPILLRNKRIIIVCKQKPKLESSQGYEKPFSIPPSYVHSGNYSSCGYTRVRRRNGRARSLSEHSVFSNDVNYVNPNGPSNFRLHTWRFNMRGRANLFGTAEGSVLEVHTPPPLPPPNHIQYLGGDENLYTTL